MRFRLAAITDEFSPDLETAACSMAGIGMTGAEFRMISGKNIMYLSDAELDAAIAIARAHGLEILSIASPILKCSQPGGPPADERFQKDIFASKHTFADQPRLAKRAFEIAERTGAQIIRVFSYWRTVDPDACLDAIIAALTPLAEEAAKRGVTIGIENEHACNVGTAAEVESLFAKFDHPNVKLVWDPANALVAGETPYPDGYAKIPAHRIAHVHAKDCRVADHAATWLPIGEGDVDWKGQIEALGRDGYTGWISLETHWGGPGGNKHEASIICGRTLRTLVE